MMLQRYSMLPDESSISLSSWPYRPIAPIGKVINLYEFLIAAFSVWVLDLSDRYNNMHLDRQLPRDLKYAEQFLCICYSN